jgi:hypothetical protein
MRNLVLGVLVFIVLDACTTKKADININTSQVLFKMAGGIGASWYATNEDTMDESPEYKWALRYKNSSINTLTGFRSMHEDNARQK